MLRDTHPLGDEHFNEIFARNHGAAEVAYYTEHPIVTGISQWEACMDARIGRGGQRRTPRCGGAE